MELGLSVVKRTSSSIDEVTDALESEGFSQTSSMLDGAIRQHENGGGFSLTAVRGPFGTVVLPSGPVRGMLYGDNAVGFGNFIDVSTDTTSEEEDNEEEDNGRESYGV